MRTAEYLNLAFFLFLIVLALLRPLPGAKRARAVLLGVAGIGVTGAAVGIGRFVQPLAASVIRDWIPLALLLMVYWQAGQFFIHPRESLQDRLLRLDQKFIYPILSWLADKPSRAWIACYGEFAYVFCYVMVPFGLVVLYLLGRGSHADAFWTAVLPPTYICYALVPFLQTLPPRILEPEQRDARQGNRLRPLNLWILRNASIHANTFPSAHVAASVAAALALFPVAPTVASVFLWVAISIAFGASIGRYHYLADVLLGGALAVAVFVLEKLFAR